MTIAEIKREPRNGEALNLLKYIMQQVEANENTTELLVFAKIGEDYHRFSTGLADMMQLVAMLELAKHDALCRMRE